MDSLMTNDMTYSEISYIKSDINSFITRLKKYSDNYNIQLDQADKSFFTIICIETIKLAVFIKC